MITCALIKFFSFPRFKFSRSLWCNCTELPWKSVFKATPNWNTLLWSYVSQYIGTNNNFFIAFYGCRIGQNGNQARHTNLDNAYTIHVYMLCERVWYKPRYGTSKGERKSLHEFDYILRNYRIRETINSGANLRRHKKLFSSIENAIL